MAERAEAEGAVSVQNPMVHNILVAEDNPVNQRVAADVLRRAGFSVDVVGNGEEVLSAVAQVKYDMLLLDCSMPVLDGLDTIRRLRANPQTAALKVLGITADAQREDREKCLAAGMDDHLAKPFAPQELVARVNYWLRWQRPLAHAPLPAVSLAPDDLLRRPALDELLELQEDEGDDLLRDLASLLRKSVERAMADLAAAAADEAWAAMGPLAHSMKSSTATLGLAPLSAGFWALEHAVREGQLDQIPAALARIQLLAAPSLDVLDATVDELVPR